MIYRDSKGRAIEIRQKEVCDNGVTLLCAVYLDTTHNEPEEVPENELEFIQKEYQDDFLQQEHEDVMSEWHDRYKDRAKYGDD